MNHKYLLLLGCMLLAGIAEAAETTAAAPSAAATTTATYIGPFKSKGKAIKSQYKRKKNWRRQGRLLSRCHY